MAFMSVSEIFSLRASSGTSFTLEFYLNTRLFQDIVEWCCSCMIGLSWAWIGARAGACGGLVSAGAGSLTFSCMLTMVQLWRYVALGGEISPCMFVFWGRLAVLNVG